jgi:hypothetical protein
MLVNWAHVNILEPKLGMCKPMAMQIIYLQ